MCPRLAAKRSSPPLGAGTDGEMRVEVRIERLVVGLGLEKFCGDIDPSCQALTSVPRRIAQDGPSLFPPLLLFSSFPPVPPPDLARSCGYVRVNIFLGKRPPSDRLQRPSRRTRLLPLCLVSLPACLMPQFKSFLICLYGGFTFITHKMKYPAFPCLWCLA